MVNVGNYAIHDMDAMGDIDILDHLGNVCFFWGVQLKAILQFPDNSRNTNQCKKGDETSGKLSSCRRFPCVAPRFVPEMLTSSYRHTGQCFSKNHILKQTRVMIF